MKQMLIIFLAMVAVSAVHMSAVGKVKVLVWAASLGDAIASGSDDRTLVDPSLVDSVRDLEHAIHEAVSGTYICV